MKLLRRVLIAFLAFAVVSVVVVKLFVGAINVPLMSKKFTANERLTHLQLPSGFQLDVFAADLPGARFLRFTRQGDLLVSFPGRDEIVLLQQKEGKNIGRTVVLDKTIVAKTGINDFADPQGMDFYRDEQQRDWLYVAESAAVGRVEFDHSRGETIGAYYRVITGLPGGGNHWKKVLRVGPDNLLYVSIGSSCNACVEKDKRRATIMRYKPDGTGAEIYASGLRNSEGFDWSPDDGALYATDNGRDMLGDDFPPCELNKIEQGQFYGWPFANGDRIKDPDNGEGHDAEITSSVAPVFGFRAHNAPLGMTFIRSATVTDAYKGAALVALHGSWNRSKKDGYKVVSLQRQADGSLVEKDFVSGFLNNDQVTGRPVDVIESPDGAFYISDDFAGAIYRVVYNAAKGN